MHLSESNFCAQATILYNLYNKFEKYTFEISKTSPGANELNCTYLLIVLSFQ